MTPSIINDIQNRERFGSTYDMIHIHQILHALYLWI
jgi:hypothetical protein